MEEQEGILQCKTNYYLLLIVLVVLFSIFLNPDIPFVGRLSINLVIILIMIAIEITRIRSINFEPSSICVNTYANKKYFFIATYKKLSIKFNIYLAMEKVKSQTLFFIFKLNTKMAKPKNTKLNYLLKIHKNLKHHLIYCKSIANNTTYN